MHGKIPMIPCACKDYGSKGEGRKNNIPSGETCNELLMISDDGGEDILKKKTNGNDRRNTPKTKRSESKNTFSISYLFIYLFYVWHGGISLVYLSFFLTQSGNLVLSCLREYEQQQLIM